MNAEQERERERNECLERQWKVLDYATEAQRKRGVPWGEAVIDAADALKDGCLVTWEESG